MITPGGQQQPATITIREEDTTPVLCKFCGCEYFTPALKIRRISRLRLGTATDQYDPVQTVICAKCKTERLIDEDITG